MEGEQDEGTGGEAGGTHPAIGSAEVSDKWLAEEEGGFLERSPNRFFVFPPPPPPPGPLTSYDASDDAWWIDDIVDWFPPLLNWLCAALMKLDLLLPNGRSDPACSEGVAPPPIELSFSLRIRNLYLSTTPRLFSHKFSQLLVNIYLLGRSKG